MISGGLSTMRQFAVNVCVWITFLVLAIVPLSLYFGLGAALGKLGWSNIYIIGVFSIIYILFVIILGNILHPRVHGFWSQKIER